jgi:hypothetical protein
MFSYDVRKIVEITDMQCAGLIFIENVKNTKIPDLRIYG